MEEEGPVAAGSDARRSGLEGSDGRAECGRPAVWGKSAVAGARGRAAAAAERFAAGSSPPSLVMGRVSE